MESDANTLVMDMAEIETMIGRHYSYFAQQFPEYADFWKGIAVQEDDHAQCLKEFAAKVAQGTVQVSTQRFNPTSVRELRNRFEGMLETMRSKSSSMCEALTSGVNVEGMLLEKNYFEVFTTQDPAVLRQLKRLAQETQEHQKKLQEMRNRFTKAAP